MRAHDRVVARELLLEPGIQRSSLLLGLAALRLVRTVVLLSLRHGLHSTS
jgi:hypothetical protein